MIDLATFKRVLSSEVALRPMPDNSILHLVQKDFRGWSATLSMKTELEQGLELEKLLGDLLVVQIPDTQRIELMQKIYPNVARLIGQLHQHYIYEISVISDNQQTYLNQVKALYYLTILVYRNVINRQLTGQHSETHHRNNPLAKLRVKKEKPYTNELLISLYKCCDLYLNLLMEQSVTYQKSPDLYWGELNFLYKIAYTRHLHSIDLRKALGVSESTTVQDVYRQACLHSLLGLSSYRRQDIVGVHKMLPEWAKKVRLTEDATSQFRLFVDLNGTSPPIHLTPYTKVNPYESDKLCLFLDLSAFEAYLDKLVKQTENTIKNPTEMRLSKIAWHTLNTKAERHEQRRLAYDTAKVISGFSLIHYYIAGKKPLSSLINRHNLPRNYIPKYDTKPKDGHSKQNTDVELIDTSNTGCRFKWEVKHSNSNETLDGGDLRVLSLFAIQRRMASRKINKQAQDTQWHIGIIRWIENRENTIEAGARIIAYTATACGLRLDNKDNRSQDFVPALLLTGDERLGTKTTLLVPYYHFRTNDKVILRMGEKQTLLKLQRLVLSSDDFEQYEMVRIG